MEMMKKYHDFIFAVSLGILAVSKIEILQKFAKFCKCLQNLQFFAKFANVCKKLQRACNLVQQHGFLFIHVVNRASIGSKAHGT